MPKLDSNLTYPLTLAPGEAELVAVAPGVQCLRMPPPFALDHINLWLVSDGEGVMLVDTGFDTDLTRSLWSRIADDRFSTASPTRLFCTHHHPDHMGLSGWLTNRFDIPLLVSDSEWDAHHQWSRPDDEDFTTMMQTYYRWSGVEAERADQDIKQRKRVRIRKRTDPRDYETVKAGERLLTSSGSWRLICGREYAPELLAPYNDDLNVLIAGDQILPGISPNIGVYPFDVMANPLQLYLDSLEEFRTLPDDTLVLPSHNLPFYGLHIRIDSLISHHELRLDATAEACRVPATAAAVAAKLFPKATGDHHHFFALGESLAHLNMLVADGILSRDVESTGQALFHAA